MWTESNTPSKIEGAGGADVPKALIYKGNNSFVSPFLLFDSPIPGGQIGIAFSGDYPGNFTKHTFYVRIAFRDRCAFPFPGAFIIAGHRPAHEQICSAVLNGFISMPISAMIAQEAVVLIP